jgi:5-carboxymethyl-2-hydroxymuconate isomerase
MPHIILEHSPNIVENVDFKHLFSRMHTALTDMGIFKLEDFKSRVSVAEHHYIADGNENNAYVHVELAVLSGRGLDAQNEAGARVMGILRETFADSLYERTCVLSVEVREMNRDTYRKITHSHSSSSGM